MTTVDAQFMQRYSKTYHFIQASLLLLIMLFAFSLLQKTVNIVDNYNCLVHQNNNYTFYSLENGNLYKFCMLIFDGAVFGLLFFGIIAIVKNCYAMTFVFTVSMAALTAAIIIKPISIISALISAESFLLAKLIRDSKRRCAQSRLNCDNVSQKQLIVSTESVINM